MNLYNLGRVAWEESQLIYHSLAHMGREGLSLVSPATPYVCIGYHQDAAQEVDLAYCQDHRIPVFRREVGGGAVYLDGGQLFFHLILRRDNPLIPKNKAAFYRKFIQPVVNVYNTIGIPAEYKPVNDVVTGKRKISGTGVGEIGECIVFVGNLIVDFDYASMARVLKVPDEKFRDKLYKTLTENLTTIRRELGERQAGRWDDTALNALMAEEFQKVTGPMQPGKRDEALCEKMTALAGRLFSDAWLFRKGKRRPSGRDVKIRAGAELVHRIHKAQGGLIRADFEVLDGRYGAVRLSGDFFCFPESGISDLEARLTGKAVSDLGALLDSFYREGRIETPGIGTPDWLSVLSVKGAP